MRNCSVNTPGVLRRIRTNSFCCPISLSATRRADIGCGNIKQDRLSISGWYYSSLRTSMSKRFVARPDLSTDITLWTLPSSFSFRSLFCITRISFVTDAIASRSTVLGLVFAAIFLLFLESRLMDFPVPCRTRQHCTTESVVTLFYNSGNNSDK